VGITRPGICGKTLLLRMQGFMGSGRMQTPWELVPISAFVRGINAQNGMVNRNPKI
jgi:hypothetical protein